MWTIFKVFIEFVTILLLFLPFALFGPEACGILAFWSGIELTPPALEGEVLSLGFFLFLFFFYQFLLLSFNSCILLGFNLLSTFYLIVILVSSNLWKLLRCVCLYLALVWHFWRVLSFFFFFGVIPLNLGFSALCLWLDWNYLCLERTPKVLSPSQGGGHMRSLYSITGAAAAAKLLQSCPTLCDPVDGSPLGSSVHSIL